MPTERMKAVFLDYDTVSSGDLDTAALAASVDELELCDTNEAALAAMLGGAQAVFLNRVRLHEGLLSGAPQLRLIALAATGTDNVDLKAAQRLGIAVCNVRGYCTAS